MREPDYVLNGDDMRRLRGPVVYVMRDSRNKPVYVGLGTRGIGRPLNPLHERIGKRYGGALEIFCCDSEADARGLEQRLIDELKPAKNRRIQPGPSAQWGSGIRPSGKGWQAFVKIRGRFVSQSFPLDTPLDVMRQWRRAQKGDAAREKLTRYLVVSSGQVEKNEK